ncbi:MAG: type II secretion system F family protein [Phycisphaeraceae bacterium]|nr:type II secretion system F family protein [Phycisphaeraceae bacterium]
MAVYAYIARDQRGVRVQGRVEAANEQAAAADLSARGLAPVRVEAATSAMPRGGRIPARRLATSYQQLSDLLRAGVPLLRSLQLLGRGRADPSLAAIWSKIADEVADGSRLADALARHPRVFPSIQVAVVRAGERGSFLEPALARLGRFLHHQAEMRSRVLGSLIYPCILLVGGVALVIAAMVFLVPQFRPQFARIETPLATRVLFLLSDLILVWWPLVVPAVIGLGIAGFVAMRRDRVRRAVASALLRVPKVGALIRGLAVARVTRVLGTLLENGIPLIQAMQTSRDASGHPLLAEALDNATEAVRGGESLTRPLAASGFFDEDVIEMISVGESANNLAQVLVSIAETLESRVDRALDLAMRLLEPLLLLLLAGGVVFIFLSLVLPLMSLSSKL